MDDIEEVDDTFEDKQAWAFTALLPILLFEIGDDVACELVLPANLVAIFMDGLCFGDELFRLIAYNHEVN